MTGMMRKGLFNCIIIAKDAHYFYILVRITGYDVINNVTLVRKKSWANVGISPFSSPPPLSQVLIPLSSYSLNSVKGNALCREVLSLIEKGAVEPAPPSLVFYSCIFVV